MGLTGLKVNCSPHLALSIEAPTYVNGSTGSWNTEAEGFRVCEFLVLGSCRRVGKGGMDHIGV